MLLELEKLLKEHVSEDLFLEIKENYDNWKSWSIFSTGIDSLSYMGILVDLEANYNLSEEKLHEINNLQDIELFLIEECKK
ncbi:hypothetical protein [Neobacillus sp.]|uniref:hypothetical protein n=1 Tax=Neobacillus sp. TaxID=2675273 RepID=UPI0035B4FB5C